MNAAIPLSEAEWEIEGEPETSLSTQQLKKRFRYSNRESIGVRVRLKGTRLWYQLHDIDLIRPRKIGFGRRLVSLGLRSLCLIPYAVIFFLSGLILFGIFSRDAAIYQGSVPPEEFDIAPLKGFLTWQLGVFCAILFVAGILARKVQTTQVPWVVFIRHEFLLYLSAIALAASLVGYFNAAIYLVAAPWKLDTVDAMWWLKVTLNTAAGSLFWCLFQRFRISQTGVNLPEWLHLEHSDLRIDAAKGRSWVLANFLKRWPGVVFFMLIPGWFKLVKDISPEATMSVAFMFVGIAALLFSLIVNQLTAFAGRLESLTPFEVLRKDPRPPVTYLRNFKADSTTAHPFGTARRELILRDICFESIGPFIAVGKPGEMIPGLGAPRIYIQSQDRKAWQSVVGKLIDESNLVFFSAELPELKSDTPPKGLTWELGQVLKEENVNKLVLAVGTHDFEARYQQFRRCFNEMFGGLLPENPPRGALIVMRDGKPCVLRGRYSMINFFAKVLGAGEGTEIFADQLYASGNISGYTYDHKGTKKTLARPNFALLFSATVIATFAATLSSVTNPYFAMIVMSAILAVIWSRRLRRTIAEYGVPLKQWRAVTENGVLDETPRDEHELIKRGQLFIIAASLVLGFIMCWAVHSDSSAPESAFLGVGTENQNGNLVVTDVAPNSSADQAGLMPGIQIISIDGHSVADQQQLSALIKSKSPGDSCVIKIVKDSKEETLNVVLGETPEIPISFPDSSSP